MRSFAWALFLLSTLLLTSGREPERRVIEVSNAGELMELFATPLNNVTVELAPGTYVLQSQTAEIPSGEGVAVNGATSVTAGLRITGRNLRLVGPLDGTAEIVSTAVIRLHFDACEGCELEWVTLSAETLSPDSSVGAAILVTNGAVRIRNCVIRVGAGASALADNGIVGVSGATLVIESNEIMGGLNNVALLEDSEAVLRKNLIEGIHAEGTGLFVGDQAVVVAERNHMHNLFEGISLAGRAALELRASIIEDIRGSGIWSSSSDLGRVRIEKNVIFRCELSGIAIRADGDQRASQNFVVETGGRKPATSGIRVHGAQADAAVRKNTLYNNTVPNDSLDRDVPREKFWRARRQWTRTYRNTPVGVDGRHRFHESAFLTRYGRWMD